MLYLLQRHPIPIVAHFRHCLVLTYALPEAVLTPLLPPGLELETHAGCGFVAVALVQTEGLRPARWPAWLGQDFFLAGYRIFSRFRTRAGRRLRGLRILRSDTNRWKMAFFGNRLTHYQYRVSDVRFEASDAALEIEIRTRDGAADLKVSADLTATRSNLPTTTVFASEREARRYAGPLPFTFDYERQTHSIIRIQGVRQNWTPRIVPVEVHRNTFFDQTAFQHAKPVFSSAFYIADIPYRWEPGIREPLNGTRP